MADLLRNLMPMLGALAIAAGALSLTPPGRLGPWWGPLLLAVLALIWATWRGPNVVSDAWLPATAVLLASLGICVVARLDSSLARRQEVWSGISLVIVIALRPMLRRIGELVAYRYVWVLASVLAFAALALFGTEVNGARLWIRVGALQIEPIELIKLCIVFFMAAYLAENADFIAAARPWSLRANLRYLAPLFLGWVLSLSILVFQRDLGMAVLLLASFAAMLYVATRRIDLIIGGIATFLVVAAWAASQYSYVVERIAIWRAPLSDPLGGGYQALQGLFSIVAGGVVGTGYRLGMPGYIPEAPTDYVYAAWSEEFGLLGAVALLGLYGLLISRFFRIARRSPDRYRMLLATGFATTLAVQVIVIVGGVIGLLPLTGITLPFLSYGGSSLVANVLMVALAMALQEHLPEQVPSS